MNKHVSNSQARMNMARSPVEQAILAQATSARNCDSSFRHVSFLFAVRMSPVQWLQGSAEYGLEWWNGIQWWQCSILRLLVPDDCQKVFSVWSEEVLRPTISFWKGSARDKFVRESRHLYGGQAGESQDRVSPMRQIRGKTSNVWRKRLPSFRNKPCLWGYVPLLRIREKELKRAIARSRPLGNQLDTCKSAVERAMTRLADCARKLEEAQRALRNADTDLHKKTRGT